MSDNKQSPQSGGGKVQIIVAVLGLLGVLATAVFPNWDKLFPAKPTASTSPAVATSSPVSPSQTISSVPTSKPSSSPISSESSQLIEPSDNSSQPIPTPSSPTPSQPIPKLSPSPGDSNPRTSPVTAPVSQPTQPGNGCNTFVGEYRDQGLGVIIPDETEQLILYNGSSIPQKGRCLSDGTIEVTFRDGYVMKGKKSAEGISWSNNTSWKRLDTQVKSRSEYENPDSKIFR